jgi:signal recognition particle receptor subunit beta
LRVDGQELTIVLRDIAGAEEHFSVPLHYVKGAARYLLAIDGTQRDSLTSALDIVAEIEQGIGPLPFVIVVNRSDLDWDLSNSEVDSAFAKYDQPWLATSAKSGENVESAFAALARRVKARLVIETPTDSKNCSLILNLAVSEKGHPA